MSRGVTAEAVARDQHATEGQRVAGPFVRHPQRQLVNREPGGFEPGDVERRLGLPFRMAEPARDELVAVDDAGVGGEDEVGHRLVRIHQLDRRAGGAQVPDQLVPFGPRPIAVDGDLLMHPRIDLV